MCVLRQQYCIFTTSTTLSFFFSRRFPASLPTSTCSFSKYFFIIYNSLFFFSRSLITKKWNFRIYTNFAKGGNSKLKREVHRTKRSEIFEEEISSNGTVRELNVFRNSFLFCSLFPFLVRSLRRLDYSFLEGKNISTNYRRSRAIARYFHFRIF